MLQEVASSVPAAGSSPPSDCLSAALAGPDGGLQSQVYGPAGGLPADLQEILYLSFTSCTPPLSKAALSDLMRQVSPLKAAPKADA